MCTKFLDWFNNEFLFFFESNNFKKNNLDKLHHNIKIIIDEPTISHNNSYKSIESIESIESQEYLEESKDEYDLYTWDIL